MNDEDLRDLFAGLALQGMWSVTGVNFGTKQEQARACYEMADAMIEAKYAEPEPEEVGITAIKRKRKTTKEE
jgi:hypothetical protein